MRRNTFKFLLSAIGLSVGCILIVSITNNLGGARSDKKNFKKVECDCPQTINAKSSISSSISATIQSQNKPTKCTEVKNTSAVQRAIVIFYPYHQSEYFFPEVRWLYRSWVEMLRSQPTTWRTDFVIFTYNFSTEFRSLGCVNRIRQNKEEPSICRLFLYVPIQYRTKDIINNNFEKAFDNAQRVMASYKDMKDPFIGVPLVTDTETFDAKRSESLYTNLRAYGYVDSINTIYEGYWTFKMYDFILRTDIDVFIYRHFANYIPQNCTLITDFNRRKLKRIAHDMGFAHAGISGMGSTWYGSPYDGYLVASETLNGMLWLAQYEFATPERESKLGTLMWPEWHYGVLLLYGQHLALNHLAATNQIRIVIGHSLLDQSTTDKSTQYISQGTRLNLHCWHTNERFSKFAFKLGQYNRSELELYRDDKTAQAYAMRMALESKYMTLDEMAALLRNISTSS
ncbi:hypothetical protein I4U23_009097 [Adineta vaga]|nr:hypothetical protein I4U23_009097 [Adineta vaga]